MSVDQAKQRLELAEQLATGLSDWGKDLVSRLQDLSDNLRNAIQNSVEATLRFPEVFSELFPKGFNLQAGMNVLQVSDAVDRIDTILRVACEHALDNASDVASGIAGGWYETVNNYLEGARILSLDSINSSLKSGEDAYAKTEAQITDLINSSLAELEKTGNAIVSYTSGNADINISNTDEIEKQLANRIVSLVTNTLGVSEETIYNGASALQAHVGGMLDELNENFSPLMLLGMLGYRDITSFVKSLMSVTPEQIADWQFRLAQAQQEKLKEFVTKTLEAMTKT